MPCRLAFLAEDPPETCRGPWEQVAGKEDFFATLPDQSRNTSPVVLSQHMQVLHLNKRNTGDMLLLHPTPQALAVEAPLPEPPFTWDPRRPVHTHLPKLQLEDRYFCACRNQPSIAARETAAPLLWPVHSPIFRPCEKKKNKSHFSCTLTCLEVRVVVAHRPRVKKEPSVVSQGILPDLRNHLGIKMLVAPTRTVSVGR